MDNFPRRAQHDKHTPAEKAITEAMAEVEKLPPDVRLTEAVVLLGQARDKVADFVDDPQNQSAEPHEKDRAP